MFLLLVQFRFSSFPGRVFSGFSLVFIVSMCLSLVFISSVLVSTVSIDTQVLIKLYQTNKYYN